MSLPSDLLSRSEVEVVLRRAAEIDGAKDRADRGGPDAGALEPMLSVSEVVRLGSEAGLESSAVMTAVAELRRGAIVERETGTIARALGDSHIVVSRVVPGPVDVVRRAVEGFLRDQLMTIRRHHGDRVEWERAEGIWPGLLRSIDFSKRYGLSMVNHIETTIVGDGDNTAVTFQIDLSGTRRERILHMGARASMAFALIGLGGAALMPGFGVADIVALAAGGVAAGGIFAIERRRFLATRERAALAPERFLDFLVHRRRTP